MLPLALLQSLLKSCCRMRCRGVVGRGVLLAMLFFSAQSWAWVAEVTLIAGPVWRINAQDQREPLARHARLQEGDRILTGSGALVHLRFVDGAHLGLREASELKIVAYRNDPVKISLELSRGTARHISGDYARQAPQSFRLSTPMAAIGVRGTDFLTGVREEKTFALLLEGAILVRQASCPGGCPETLISQPKTLATVDLQGGVQTRLLDPAEIQHLIGNPRLAKAAAAADAAVPNEPDKNHALLNRLPGDLPASNAPPELIWVRWLAIGRLDENFSRPHEAMQGETDYQPLATNLSYTLWRREPEGASWVPGGGTVNLRLDQVAARYTNGFMSLPVVMESGRLQLQLNDQGFSTQLVGRLADGQVPHGLESLARSQTLLDLRGRIDHQGRLLGRTQSAEVTGGVALDKNSAGYLFKTQAPYGQIDGVTLWKR